MINSLPVPGDRYRTKASIPAAYLQQGVSTSPQNLTEKFIHSDVQIEVMESDIENYTKVKTLGGKLMGTHTNVFYIAEEFLLNPLNKTFLAESTVEVLG